MHTVICVGATGAANRMSCQPRRAGGCLAPARGHSWELAEDMQRPFREHPDGAVGSSPPALGTFPYCCGFICFMLLVMESILCKTPILCFCCYNRCWVACHLQHPLRLTCQLVMLPVVLHHSFTFRKASVTFLQG